MCKILCLTSHDPARRDEIIQAAWNDMKRTEFDGYGAAWFSASGEIGYYKTRWANIPTVDAPAFVQPAFGDYNDVPSDGGYLIIHARAQTTGTGINVHNTHPMLSTDGNMALIHNGCVYANGRYKNIAPCTCDSELLLLAYQDGGIDAVSKYIGGKFAFMTLQFKDGKKTLHIAKDNEKNLFVAQMPDGAYAIGTARHLFDTLTDLKLGVGAPVELGEFKDHHLLVFGRTEGIELAEFEPYKAGATYVDDYEGASWYHGKYVGHQSNQQAQQQLPKKPAIPDPVVSSILDDTDEIRRQEREPMPA